MLQLVFNSPKRMGKNGYTLYVYKYSIQLLYGIKGGTQCKVEKPPPYYHCLMDCYSNSFLF